MIINNNNVNELKFNNLDVNVLKYNGNVVWLKKTPGPEPELFDWTLAEDETLNNILVNAPGFSGIYVKPGEWLHDPDYKLKLYISYDEYYDGVYYSVLFKKYKTVGNDLLEMSNWITITKNNSPYEIVFDDDCNAIHIGRFFNKPEYVLFTGQQLVDKYNDFKAYIVGLDERIGSGSSPYAEFYPDKSPILLYGTWITNTRYFKTEYGPNSDAVRRLPNRYDKNNVYGLCNIQYLNLTGFYAFEYTNSPKYLFEKSDQHSIDPNKYPEDLAPEFRCVGYNQMMRGKDVYILVKSELHKRSFEYYLIKEHNYFQDIYGDLLKDHLHIMIAEVKN